MTVAKDSQLEKIGASSFRNSRVEGITIPRNVTEIGSSAFENCRCLQQATFEDGCVLRAIGENAFRNCKGFWNIRLSTGLETIGDCCFWGSSLRKVFSHEYAGSRSRGGLLLRAAEARTVELGSGETVSAPSSTARERTSSSLRPKRESGVRRFRGGNLVGIEIPNGAEAIGENCFRQGGLRETVLPSTLRDG